MTAASARHSGAVHWRSWTTAAEDRWHDRQRPGRPGAVGHLRRLPGRDLHPAARLAPRVTAASAARPAPEADPGRGGEAAPAQAVAAPAGHAPPASGRHAAGGSLTGAGGCGAAAWPSRAAAVAGYPGHPLVSAAPGPHRSCWPGRAGSRSRRHQGAAAWHRCERHDECSWLIRLLRFSGLLLLSFVLLPGDHRRAGHR